MASILNKAGSFGSIVKVTTNSIPSYSRSEKLRELVLKSKQVNDISTSFMKNKIFKRDIKMASVSVSCGINVPVQTRLYHSEICKFPDYDKYRKDDKLNPNVKFDDPNLESRKFTYTMIFGTGLVTVLGAKEIVRGVCTMLNPNAKALAEASIEVDLSTIPEGKNIVLKWRNKPLFIRHRTPEDITRESEVAISELRDPQADADRVQKPEWLILVGICTHLGCVPIANAGDFHGFYCPCHASHYDGSGRVRKGPAPLNLEVPEYKFLSDTSVVVG